MTRHVKSGPVDLGEKEAASEKATEAETEDTEHSSITSSVILADSHA